MKLHEVNLFPGLESKKINISHWDSNIGDAYIITLNDGRKMIRYDKGRTINNDITQGRTESYEDFRQRVKRQILSDAKWEK